MTHKAMQRVEEACYRAGTDLHTLFERPFSSIVAFADDNDLAMQDLLAVCISLLADLDAVENHIKHLNMQPLH